MEKEEDGGGLELSSAFTNNNSNESGRTFTSRCMIAVLQITAHMKAFIQIYSTDSFVCVQMYSNFGFKYVKCKTFRSQSCHNISFLLCLAQNLNVSHRKVCNMGET